MRGIPARSGAVSRLSIAREWRAGRQSGQQAEFLLGAQTGGVLGGEPIRDEGTGRLRVDLDQSLAGSVLELCQGIEWHRLIGAGDRILLVSRDETGQGSQAGAGFCERGGCAPGLEPGRDGGVGSGGLPRAAQGVDQGDAGGDIGTGRLEGGRERLGDLGAAGGLPGPISLEQGADAFALRALWSRRLWNSSRGGLIR